MRRATLSIDEGKAPDASIRQIASASLVGSVVEWYDFFLYGTMAALVFNSQFFPTFDPLTGTLAAFTTFAAGFVTRPIGGVVFGHLGDRMGRKPMLVVTMMIMGLSTFAMGLLPTYESIGVAAPLLLVLLRMFQGIGLGGEWGGAVLLCVEHAPQERRGWYSSWPQLGVPIGLLLSTGAVKALGPLGEDALLAGAWRIPFLASIVLVGIGLFIRLRIAEPPAFRDLVENDARARVPLLEVVRRHPKVTLLAMGARISESVTFNVYNAFLVTYVVTVLSLKNTVALNALLVAAAVGFFVILGAAHVSDRIGRRPVFMAGAAVAALSAFPIFALLDTKSSVLITLAVVIGWAFGACTMFGAEGVLFAELYPTRVRYSGMSTVYQLGVLPSGAVAPIICTLLIERFDNQAWPVATYVVAMALITLVSLAFLPETFRRDLRGHETSPVAPEDERVANAVRP
jgi:MHS family shikimate/dehydroshikimate transporter-like MFS transporter